jgi:hypothetical protein
MPKGLLFWILMILWAVLGIYQGRPNDGKWNWGGVGGSLLLFVLLFLLGWGIFGFAIR